LVSGHSPVRPSSVLPAALFKASASATSSFGTTARPVHSLSTLRSQGRPLSPRKTRFRLVTSLGRTGFEPAGLHREVSLISFYMRSPSPRLGLEHKQEREYWNAHWLRSSARAARLTRPDKKSTVLAGKRRETSAASSSSNAPLVSSTNASSSSFIALAVA